MILSVAVLFSLFIAASMISNSVASQLIVKKTESLVTSTVEQTDRYLSFLFTKVRDSASFFYLVGRQFASIANHHIPSC